MSNIRKIAWEDFLANYTTPEPQVDDEFDDIEDDEFDDNDIPAPSSKIMPFNIGILSGIANPNTISTPWGNFSRSNKMAPHNFYELKIAHFRGFSVLSIPDFAKKIEEVEGLAIFKILDPYCIIVGKAKLYEWPEVIDGFNKVFIDSTSEKYAKSNNDALQDFITSLSNKGDYTAVFFPNGKSECVFSSDENYETRSKEILSLKGTMFGLSVIVNGEVQ